MSVKRQVYQIALQSYFPCFDCSPSDGEQVCFKFHNFSLTNTEVIAKIKRLS